MGLGTSKYRKVMRTPQSYDFFLKLARISGESF